MTTIIFKNSKISGVAPTETDLVIGEVAINIPDGKLFYTNNGVQEVTNPDIKASINSITLTGEGDIVTITSGDLAGKAPLVHTHTTDSIDDGEIKAIAPIYFNDDVAALDDLVLSNEARINALRQVNTEGKVKIDGDSTAKYLEDVIDGSSVVLVDGLLQATKINGTTATVPEINNLSGLRENLQVQINKLTTLYKFDTTVATYQDLLSLESDTGSLVFVTTDETHNGDTSIFIFDGNEWIYCGGFRAEDIRDFTVNPIDLATETIGTLDNIKLDIQHATQTAMSTNDFGSNVEDALTTLHNQIRAVKSYLVDYFGGDILAPDSITTIANKANQIKTAIGAAIISAGGTADEISFTNLAGDIDTIPHGEVVGMQKSITQTVARNGTITVVFNADVTLDEICATLLSVVPGATVNIHNKSFTANSDGYSLNDLVEFFPTGMKPKIEFTFPLDNDDGKYTTSIVISPQIVVF